MTTNDLILLIVYSIGIISNVIIFFIQKTEIKKLRSITDQVERYFKIFDVDTFEKFVKLKEKGFEQEKEIMLRDVSIKLSDEYMEKIGKPELEKGITQFKDAINDQYNEMGWFVVEFLSYLPKKNREKLIKNHFPLTGQFIRDYLKEYEKGLDEKGTEGKGE